MTARLLRGWEFERFSGSEIADATGETWALSASVGPGGVEVMVFRWQIAYTRKAFREAVAR